MPARFKQLARPRFAPLSLPIAAVTIIAFAMAANVSAQVSSTQNIPAGSTVYRNTQYHFSLVVPPGYEFNELPDSSGYALQIVFDDPVVDKTADSSFIISIMPYSQANLAAVGGNLGEGFKLDQPDGTMDQGEMLGTVDVYVNDLVNFDFEKNGTSFAVSSLKDNGPQLANILKTWQFSN